MRRMVFHVADAISCGRAFYFVVGSPFFKRSELFLSLVCLILRRGVAFHAADGISWGRAFYFVVHQSCVYAPYYLI